MKEIRLLSISIFFLFNNNSIALEIPNKVKSNGLVYIAATETEGESQKKQGKKATKPKGSIKSKESKKITGKKATKPKKTTGKKVTKSKKKEGF
ncbi:hypothetical protein [Colwellia sp. Bg11-28]|uniref:hypothetical protein n=1 Tax=Colwellia sp. Bg11-28 TaxID=2058305 RepID=UPI0012FF324F|nr:hypothetical protein [Colwellia sp. Bg11-28]